MDAASIGHKKAKSKLCHSRGEGWGPRYRVTNIQTPGFVVDAQSLNYPHADCVFSAHSQALMARG